MHDPQMLKHERYEAARRVTVVGAVINLVLSVAKVFAGIVGNSAAMIADGIHSVSDLVTDAAVVIGMRAAKREADADHPYGHGKFEALATLFIAVALLAVAVGIGWDAVGRIREPELAPPTLIALLAAVVSIFSKEALYHYTVRVGRRYDSKTLIANAWHHRSDAISSVAALAGIGGAMFGYPILDPLAALAVAAIIAKVGIDLLLEAVHELTDSANAVDEAVRTRIHELVNEIPEVHSAHFLTPRRMGPDIFVDVHVVVDGFLSVSEGHQVAEKVRHRLLTKVDAVTDVMVHVDPEDDQDKDVPLLSDRKSLKALIGGMISETPGLLTGIARLTPHYRRDGIVLDLVLESDPQADPGVLRTAAGELAGRLIEANADLVEVRSSFSAGRERRTAQS